MAAILSLKNHHESISLKDQASVLENQIAALQQKNLAQLGVEQDLKQEYLALKQEASALAQHVAELEATKQQHENLQSALQIEKLGNHVNEEKSKLKLKADLKKAREDLRLVRTEFNLLKALDPARLKRQLTDLKKKTAAQNNDNKRINNTLVKTRRELAQSNADRDNFEAELKALQAENKNEDSGETEDVNTSLPGSNLFDHLTVSKDLTVSKE